jgi:hypothetical protein
MEAMALTITEVSAITGSAGIVLGYILRAARSWFGMDKDVDGLKQDLGDLKKHAADTDKHIVKGREDLLAKMLTDNFASLNKKVDAMNGRCESRFIACQGRFGTLDKKVAAITGDDNGE